MSRTPLSPTLLKNYQAPEIKLVHVNITFEIDAIRTIVHTELDLQNHAVDDHLRLFGENLELIEISLDGRVLQPHEYEYHEQGLIVFHIHGAHLLRTTVAIQPASNSTLEGLYASGGQLCTQCESEGFRRITFYPDRPDVLSTFTTTLIAQPAQYPVLLANGNLKSEETLADGSKKVVWHDPFPKPSYLFAMVAGTFRCLERTISSKSGAPKLLQLYIDSPDLAEASHAMDSLIAAIRWEEQVFGLELDLDRYMVVAVEHFNLGAMENKGLNIFNSKYILCSPESATDTEFDDIESIIAHEYFHNWTGNRVTLRDWFQLCLKEGLTVYREQKFVSDLHGESVPLIQRVKRLRERQFPEDSGPMAHPVRPSSYLEINNFYTSTVYEKGAELIHMLEVIAGREALVKAICAYLAAFDGCAATVEDFLSAVAESTGLDLRQYKQWYLVAGTPHVHVRATLLEGIGTRLEITQSNALSSETLHIPISVGFLGKDSGIEIPLGTSSLVQLSQQKACFDFPQVKVPAIPSLGRGFSAPVEIHFDYSDEDLLTLLQHDSDSFCRWDAGQRLILKVMQQMVAQVRQHQALTFPDSLKQGFATLFAKRHEDLGLFLELIDIPPELYLMEKLQDATVEIVREIHNFFRNRLAHDFMNQWWELFQLPQDEDSASQSQSSAVRRRARCRAISFLVQSGSQEALTACREMYLQSKTMTETLGALSALAQQESPLRMELLERFYHRWRETPLLLCKWFGLHALANVSNVATQIRSLMRHPKFDLRNPNHVRSLLFTFANDNHFRFHDPSGIGYQIIEETVTTLDKINPQVASGLLQILRGWRRYDSTRQELMRMTLSRVVKLPGLSADVLDVATRCLDASPAQP